MTNTERYYREMMELVSCMNFAERDYLKALESLEPHKGSPYAEAKEAEARANKEYRQGAARERAWKAINEIIEAMHKSVDNYRIDPPTAEQLRLLEALKMRESVPLDELKKAANAVKDNAACIGVINEIAHKNGHFWHEVVENAISTDEAHGRIDALLRTAQRLSQGKFQGRTDFKDETEAISRFAGFPYSMLHHDNGWQEPVVNETRVKAFMNVVNAATPEE